MLRFARSCICVLSIAGSVYAQLGVEPFGSQSEDCKESVAVARRTNWVMAQNGDLNSTYTWTFCDRVVVFEDRKAYDLDKDFESTLKKWLAIGERVDPRPQGIKDISFNLIRVRGKEWVLITRNGTRTSILHGTSLVHILYLERTLRDAALNTQTKESR
jgi:hypothetical protein